jgi:hypothetical protein
MEMWWIVALEKVKISEVFKLLAKFENEIVEGAE